MPKKPKFELVRSIHFAWRLTRRSGVWCADGRSNATNVGRHSLGTRNKTEALQLLARLDEACAVKHGLIPKTEAVIKVATELSLAEGRRLYEAHIGRARVTGGVKESTKKRYRAVFDKFIPWAVKHGIAGFQQVDADVLNSYATHLEKEGFAPKTLLNELTTLKQTVRWLIEEKKLIGREPIKLKLRKIESQRAYCYQPAEVAAILERCRQVPSLRWIGNVVTGLACTGMRIDELANFKWADIDFANTQICLADESGRAATGEAKRTLKSGRSRSLPLHPDFARVLAELPKLDQYVFHGPKGGRLKPDFVRRMFVCHVLKPLAGRFPPVNGGQSFIDGRLHSFRHYFISTCAAAGVPERVVMTWCGHSSSAMVRIYFHMFDREAQRQMNGLNLLGGVAGRSDDQGPKS
jgi:integrase